MSDKSSTYDVFISHASEDKDLIVRPLAKELDKRGIRVWFDEFELSWGDSLTESIDYGLSNSRYGIVVLSHSFFGKDWPERELRGLLAKNLGEEKVLLPLWYDLDREDVLEYSPPLADLLTLSIDEHNVSSIADEFVEEFSEGSIGKEDQPSGRDLGDESLRSSESPVDQYKLSQQAESYPVYTTEAPLEQSSSLSSTSQSGTAIIGCGGAGIRMLNVVEKLSSEPIETVSIDTDEEELKRSHSNTSILLRTLDWEGNDDITSALSSFFKTKDSIFVVAGFGGETGSTVAPTIVEAATSAGANVTSVCTLPLSIESHRRRAINSLKSISIASNSVIVYDFDQMVDIYSGTPIGPLLNRANKEISQVLLWIANHNDSVFPSKQLNPDPPDNRGVYSFVSLKADDTFEIKDRLLSHLDFKSIDWNLRGAVFLFAVKESESAKVIADYMSQMGKNSKSLYWGIWHSTEIENAVQVLGIVSISGKDLDKIFPVDESRDMDYEIIGTQLDAYD